MPRQTVKISLDSDIVQAIEKRFVGPTKKFSTRSAALEYLILTALGRQNDPPKEVDAKLVYDLNFEMEAGRKIAFLQTFYSYYKTARINGEAISKTQCIEAANCLWNRKRNITKESVSLALINCIEAD